MVLCAHMQNRGSGYGEYQGRDNPSGSELCCASRNRSRSLLGAYAREELDIVEEENGMAPLKGGRLESDSTCLLGPKVKHDARPIFDKVRAELRATPANYINRFTYMYREIFNLYVALPRIGSLYQSHVHYVTQDSWAYSLLYRDTPE